MFKVELDDVAVVERGQVAVVVSNVGEEPPQVKKLVEETAKARNWSQAPRRYEQSRSRFDVGIERYVVPKGFRGIQQEVAGPGIYYLNRRAYIVYIVDTTNITIDWDDAEADPLRPAEGHLPGRLRDQRLGQGHHPGPARSGAVHGGQDRLHRKPDQPRDPSDDRFELPQPGLVHVGHELHAGPPGRAAQGRGARPRELEKYHVECVSVLICQINLPQELMDTQTKKIIAQQQQAMYQDQQKAEQTRIATEKTRAEADQQKNLVEAEIGVKIAEQNKQKAIRFAEGEAESIRLRAEGEAKGIRAKGDAEGSKILAIGEATAKAYELQNKADGSTGRHRHRDRQADRLRQHQGDPRLPGAGRRRAWAACSPPSSPTSSPAGPSQAPGRVTSEAGGESLADDGTRFVAILAETGFSITGGHR